MSNSGLEIRYSEDALLVLRRLNKRKLIREKIIAFAGDPDAARANVIKLKGRQDFRLRVQDWRVIFRIEDDVMFVDSILPRGSAYEVS